MSDIKTIVCVCTGNSCRSVMAAALLSKMLAEKGNYKIKTAGTAAIKGMGPTPETVQALAEEDIDVSGHLSQQVSQQIIQEADLILVMERSHQENIVGLDPSSRSKVHLLTEFGRVEKEHKLVNPDIPDPIGRSLDFYRQVLNIIKEGVLRTIKRLEAQ